MNTSKYTKLKIKVPDGGKFLSKADTENCLKITEKSA